MINKVILIGNLGRDPEVRTLESGTKVARISMATNENYKDKSGEWQTRTEWHDVVAWTYLADKADRKLKKGSKAYVEGKLTHRKYQDKDGIDRYVTEVRANVLKSLDPRGDSSGSASGTPFPDEKPEEVDPFSEDLSESSIETEETEEEDEDDLPF